MRRALAFYTVFSIAPLLIISIAVVVLGFILMSGTTDIYSTTKIVVAPVVVLGGFALGFFAIFKKPSQN